MLPCLYLHQWVLRILQVRRFLENLYNAVDAGHTHADHNKDHGQHHERHQRTDIT